MFTRKSIWVLCATLAFLHHTLRSEENFLLINGKTHEVINEMGSHIDERMTPCSTFKMALAIMGFDSGLLQNESVPIWEYQEGYDDYLESWKAPHNPQLWMQHSCVWYSKLLTQQLGDDHVQHYLDLLDYGNRDFSGGLTEAWLSSSLKISVREEVQFVQRLVKEDFAVSERSLQLTKTILLREELSGGWKLYGKTGLGSYINGDGKLNKIGWFVGWFENEEEFYPFAYQIRDKTVDPALRVSRAKELFFDHAM